MIWYAQSEQKDRLITDEQVRYQAFSQCFR